MDEMSVALPVEDDEELEFVRGLAVAGSGVRIEEQIEAVDGFSTQVDPVTCVLVFGGAMFLAKAIHSWWTARRGGLVIDQRAGAAEALYRDRNVPAGYVITYPADGGKVEVKTVDEPKDAVERLIASIISGSFGAAKSLADAAGKVVGNDNVKLEPV